MKFLPVMLVFALSLASALGAPRVPPEVQHQAEGGRGMAVTAHPLATEAAMNILRSGGNAVDAAVAAGLTLGVVDAHNSGIGGGCFFLLRSPEGRVRALDGREMAPATATRNMFLRDGQAVPELSRTGALAPGIPGSLAVYDLVLREHGRRSLAQCLLPAAEIAEQGFPIDPSWESKLRSAAPAIRTFPETARILLKPDGSLMKTGDVIRQPDLARTYRAIADEGIDHFYRGDFSRRVAAWMREHAGRITEADFDAYRVVEREPVRSQYRGYTMVGFPPPSSGGVHVAQMLNILEGFDLASLKEPQRTHVIVESMKLAFADRAHWLGDPDFVPVPRGLVDPAYARDLAARISLDRAVVVPSHGQPPRASEDVFKKHTTHFVTADAEGWWVACTATVNTSFGSKVIVPGTGVVLNNQMDDFAAAPGAPNAFGLLGAEANAVAPGKRPLSSMSPTLVLDGNQPVLSVGAAGGPTIITQTLLAILRYLDLDLPLHDSMGQPRFHHQWSPDEVRMEQGWNDGDATGLEALGHKVRVVDRFGVSQAIAFREGKFEGVSEPRGQGRAEGW